MVTRTEFWASALAEFIEYLLDGLLPSPQRDLVRLTTEVANEDRRLVVLSEAPMGYQEPSPQ